MILRRFLRAIAERPIAAAFILALYALLAMLGSTLLADGFQAVRRGDVRASVDGWMMLLIATVIGVGSIASVLWAVAGLLPRAGGYRAGLCQSCGYDLRASTGRCPECGQPFHVMEGKRVVYGEDPNL